jgi:2-oxoglutarate dehydrogenase E2 component (dihydrolipoamide succinyltransferase)
MAVVPVVMPRLGESVAEATLSKWMVKEGDAIQVDQTIAEASTDKADTELPSPVAGRVVRLLVLTGQTVNVGTPILEIETDAKATVAPPAPAPIPAKKEPVAAPAAPAAAPSSSPVPAPALAPGARLSGPRPSPLVRRMAREHHVDLSQVKGTGANGRDNTRDMEAFLAARGGRPAAASAPAIAEIRAIPTTTFKPPEYRPLPGDELVPFTRRRRLIAEHMVYSKHVSPHVFCLAEIDMHAVDRARKAMPKGAAPSLLAFVAAAVVRAVRDYPIVNATVLADAYAIHKVVNLGVAVDTPEGLIVPVLQRANELSLASLTRAIAESAEKARAGKLTADELAGGTLTLSNPGLKGNTWGAAVISQPQVAILRMGSVIKRPVVVTTDGEDAIVIRPIMELVLSYDHRIIDGAAANGYLFRVRELLESAPGSLS